MYVPSFNAVTDPVEIAGTLSKASVAQFVTFGAEGLEATIVPILWDAPAPGESTTDAEGPLGRIRLHLARANPQWCNANTEVEALLIVSGPDAYVSPSWYPTKQHDSRVLPTWNYETLHARGHLVVHDDGPWTEQVVRDLTDRHEAARPEPWSVDDAPADFVAKMLRAIVGLEVVLSRVEAKRKLSQNRPVGDAAGVIAALASRPNPADQAVAQAMRRIFS